jgi:hypothetical protein
MPRTPVLRGKNMTYHYHQTGKTRADFVLQHTRETLLQILKKPNEINSNSCYKSALYQGQNMPSDAKNKDVPNNKYENNHFLEDCITLINDIQNFNGLEEKTKEKLEIRKTIIACVLDLAKEYRASEQHTSQYDTMN